MCVELNPGAQQLTSSPTFLTTKPLSAIQPSASLPYFCLTTVLSGLLESLIGLPVSRWRADLAAR